MYALRYPGNRWLRHAGVWLLLAALLLLQARAAIGGCLLAYLDLPTQVAAVIAENAASVSAADMCCPDGDSAVKVCGENCREAVSSPSPAIDATLGLAPIDFLYPSFVSQPHFECRDVVHAAATRGTGPPAFLRYLRLLI